MTPHQSIVARKFLGWGVQVMEARTGVPAATVSGFEQGKNVSGQTFQRIKGAYEDHGITFLKDGETSVGWGVSLRA
jgi:transcriptional regulator with XRE-family HTH domain